jgi:hypothetical protein
MLKHRPGDQPLPVQNERQSIQDLVIADIETRKKVGLERYGTLLQADNKRDSLRDAYEEALDLTCYLRQAIEERDVLNMLGFPVGLTCLIETCHAPATIHVTTSGSGDVKDFCYPHARFRQEEG